ncbi:MAG: arginine deiminase-related protein [Ferruginibacter sp.]
MQNSNHLLMIQPVNFGFNAETAVNNSFQADTGENVQALALEEFNNLVELLKAKGIYVSVIADTPEPFTPDSIFPNNWISFHEIGEVVLYPMFAANRRLERKSSVLDYLRNEITISHIHDLSVHENENRFLEGTGSMVLDRKHRIAYASLSPRTSETLVKEFCGIMDYKAVTFHSFDNNGSAIYHTNVMMSIGNEFAIVCLDAVTAEPEKQQLISCFTITGKEIIDISMEQVNNFAGNMLQVVNKDGQPFLIMSSRAYNSLSSVQKIRLGKYNELLHVPLTAIETAGGGSARCMIAEIFNAPANKKAP